jgi:hypothetical protein
VEGIPFIIIYAIILAILPKTIQMTLFSKKMIFNTAAISLSIITMGIALIYICKSVEKFQMGVPCGSAICSGDTPVCLNGVCSPYVNKALPNGTTVDEAMYIQPIMNTIPNPDTYINRVLPIYRAFAPTPIYGRYIRIRPSISSGDGNLYLSQIMVYGPPVVVAPVTQDQNSATVRTGGNTSVISPSNLHKIPINIAAGKPVFATSTLSGTNVLAASSITDGTASTRSPGWAAANNSRLTQYIDVDLGSTMQVYSFVIYGREDCCADNMLGLRVQVLTTNNADATPVIEIKLPIKDKQQRLLFISSNKTYPTDLRNFGLTDKQAAIAYVTLQTDILTLFNTDPVTKMIDGPNLSNQLKPLTGVITQSAFPFDRNLTISTHIQYFGMIKFTSTLINASLPTRSDPVASYPDTPRSWDNIDILSNLKGTKTLPQIKTQADPVIVNMNDDPVKINNRALEMGSNKYNSDKSSVGSGEMDEAAKATLRQKGFVALEVGINCPVGSSKLTCQNPTKDYCVKPGVDCSVILECPPGWHKTDCFESVSIESSIRADLNMSVPRVKTCVKNGKKCYTNEFSKEKALFDMAALANNKDLGPGSINEIIRRVNCATIIDC